MKILISGDVQGKLPDLYKRVDLLEKNINNKFDILFCIGDFFGYDSSFIEEYKSKKRTASIKTYVISPYNINLKLDIDKNGCEIAENIIYLGIKGCMELANKLTVAFNSQTEIDLDSAKDLIDRLKCTGSSYKGVDLLFTNCWPTNIEKDCENIPKNMNLLYPSEICSAMSSLILPRYHFVGCSQQYYERIPYKNSATSHVTRFLALGAIKNKAKEKAIYAVNIEPMLSMKLEELLTIPKLVTENPYSEMNVMNILGKERQQFFFELPDKSQEPKKELKRKKSPETNPDETEEAKKSRILRAEGCWFCLGNPQVERHLIVYVSQETYLAMPRGALHSDHLMLITVGHYQSLVSTPVHVFKEIRFMQKIIRDYFQRQNQAVVFFERNFKTNHFQMQAVPIPIDKLEMCKELFLELGVQDKGPSDNFREIPSKTNLIEIVKSGMPYLYVELSNGDKLFGTLDKERFYSFDAQFARIVLCHKSILNCPEKQHWKNCIESHEQEIQLTQHLKQKILLLFQ